MNKALKKAIVCSLMVSFMQGGLVTPLIVAAQENNAQQNQEQQQETEFQKQKRQEQQRQQQQRQQDQQRQEQQRQEQQRQQQQRQQDQQRQQEQQQRQNKERQEKERQEKQRQEQQRKAQKQYDWSHDAYRDNNWHRVSESYNERTNFRWHETSYSMRNRFSSSDYWMEPIYDRDWNDRFPGLHSYRWHDKGSYGNGYFWYGGRRIYDCTLFYNNWDEMVGIGFIFDNVFVFIRDDREVYRHHDASLLAIAFLLLSQEDHNYWQREKRYDWSDDAYWDDNWSRIDYEYRDPSPFRWHESRHSLRQRFSNIELERIYDRDWNDRFPGLHSYRWHDSDDYNDGYYWYRGERIRNAVLFFDDWDELVGIGFTYDDNFVFIRDDRTVYHRNKNNDALLWGIALYLLLR